MKSLENWNAVTAVVFSSLVILALLPALDCKLDDIEVDATEVNNWALRFGKSIVEASSEATHLERITRNFVDLGATVEWVDATQMIEEMRVNVQNVLAWKRLAVERIAEMAEHLSSGHQHDKTLKYEFLSAKPPPEISNESFYETVDDGVADKRREIRKSIRESDLKPHPKFANAPVSFKESSVHVPVNVNDREVKVINAIKWSENVNAVFRNNRQVDPSLNWQYFGSSTGFLRMFPATIWTGEGRDKPDLYDCRTRPWFVKAAASAKDVVILVDGSGSMTGVRKEIARNVIMDILATLTEDDFFTILSFSEDIECVVPCFENSLVQANEENIREFSRHLGEMETQNIANFTLSFITAFELLQRYNRSTLGTQCNQAIMLVTDGAPNTFEDIFRRYNYPNIPVRVFTYLIGKEVTEVQEVNWMACANKGYFTHVSSLPEVRDQVLKYVPVMSRPIALSGLRPYIWTSVYADVPRPHRKYRKKQPLQLMTTVAAPVFDKKHPKAANLLGVAGTDVPISQITKLTRAYKIGVNAYSFAINNNGHVLYHPELRALFQDLVRPGYKNVDLTEVESVDINSLLYEYDDTLLTIRKNMVDRRIGWGKMSVKSASENFKRVVTRNNSYYYGPIDDTPFSLAVALPEPYGHYRVVGQVEVKRKEEDWLQYFAGNNWRVHPDWVYCENPQKEEDIYNSPEENIRIFLSDALSTQNFRWRTISTRPQIFDKPICEKDLLQGLVFDAKATLIDTSKNDSKKDDVKMEDRVVKMFGIATTFVATRSGLMRFDDLRPDAEKANYTEKPIFHHHTRATEEEFYKRAVDFHYINSSAFVFSVPFNTGSRKVSAVTGSHAVFLGTGKKKAPVAVVGLQFKHTSFSDRFFDTTSKCMQSCRYKCSDDELNCYLLDNNGFIIVSEQHDDTGKFFGEIDYTLFDSMIEIGIYKRVHVYDYQAICLEPDTSYGDASFLLTPFYHIKNMFWWFWAKFIFFYAQFSLYEWRAKDLVTAFSDADYYSDEDTFNKTIPRPCEKEIDLFEMLPRDFGEPVKGRLSMCHSSGCDKQFIVQPVPYTNLVMLVVYTTCPCETTSIHLEPKEIEQNETLRCTRMKQNIHRRRPPVCVNYHPEESDMSTECGGSNNLCASSVIVILFIALFSQRLRFFLV